MNVTVDRIDFCYGAIERPVDKRPRVETSFRVTVRLTAVSAPQAYCQNRPRRSGSRRQRVSSAIRSISRRLFGAVSSIVPGRDRQLMVASRNGTRWRGAPGGQTRGKDFLAVIAAVSHVVRLYRRRNDLIVHGSRAMEDGTGYARPGPGRRYRRDSPEFCLGQNDRRRWRRRRGIRTTPGIAHVRDARSERPSEVFKGRSRPGLFRDNNGD